MGILITIVLPLALAFIMFSLGLGLTGADFTRVLKRPFAFLIGAGNQIILVPLVAYVLAIALGLSAELAVGLMILSFCPGGVTSNIMTKLAKGDVALSVSLTAVVSLLSMLTVPILVAWSVHHFMGNEAPPISITGLAISVFLITTLPVLIGVAVRHYFSTMSMKIEPNVSRAAMVLFVVIVVAALAGNWETFVSNLPVLGPAVILLNIVLIVLGASIAKAAGLTLQEVKTVAVETGIQNSTVGITLGTIVAAQATGFSAFSLPSAVYGITMYLVTVPILLWIRNKTSKA